MLLHKAQERERCERSAPQLALAQLAGAALLMFAGIGAAVGYVWFSPTPLSIGAYTLAGPRSIDVALLGGMKLTQYVPAAQPSVSVKTDERGAAIGPSGPPAVQAPIITDDLYLAPSPVWSWGGFSVFRR